LLGGFAYSDEEVLADSKARKIRLWRISVGLVEAKGLKWGLKSMGRSRFKLIHNYCSSGGLMNFMMWHYPFVLKQINKIIENN
jgi:hypothetical protein